MSLTKEVDTCEKCPRNLTKKEVKKSIYWVDTCETCPHDSTHIFLCKGVNFLDEITEVNACELCSIMFAYQYLLGTRQVVLVNGNFYVSCGFGWDLITDVEYAEDYEKSMVRLFDKRHM